VDLLIVGVVFVATYVVAHLLIPAYAGPVTLILTLVVCTWRLAVAHSSWGDLGLRPPERWLRTILWAFGLLVASELAALLIVNPIAQAADLPALDISRFAGVRGNWRALLGWLLVAWTSAAVAEELVFRGYLLSRLQILFGATPLGITCAVLLQAACFGAGHVYLGSRGVLIATVMGLLYGAAYVGTGRNLPALMLAHGATDSLSLISIYAGAVS